MRETKDVVTRLTKRMRWRSKYNYVHFKPQASALAAVFEPEVVVVAAVVAVVVAAVTAPTAASLAMPIILIAAEATAAKTAAQRRADQNQVRRQVRRSQVQGLQEGG